MQHFKFFQVIVLLSFIFLSNLNGEAIIDIGEIAREEGEAILNISINSKSEEICLLAKRAFNSHGGYKLMDQGDIQLKLELLGSYGVGFTLLTDKGNQQLTGKIKADSLNNAVFKACDLVRLKKH